MRSEYDFFLTTVDPLRKNKEEQREEQQRREEIERKKADRRRRQSGIRFAYDDIFEDREKAGVPKSEEVNFDGDDIQVELEVGIEEVLFRDGASKEITFELKTPCKQCKGTREASGVRGPDCYSCKGTGIRKDPLFKREQICKTC